MHRASAPRRHRVRAQRRGNLAIRQPRRPHLPHPLNDRGLAVPFAIRLPSFTAALSGLMRCRAPLWLWNGRRRRLVQTRVILTVELNQAHRCGKRGPYLPQNRIVWFANLDRWNLNPNNGRSPRLLNVHILFE